MMDSLRKYLDHASDPSNYIVSQCADAHSIKACTPKCQFLSCRLYDNVITK